MYNTYLSGGIPQISPSTNGLYSSYENQQYGSSVFNNNNSVFRNAPYFTGSAGPSPTLNVGPSPYYANMGAAAGMGASPKPAYLAGALPQYMQQLPATNPLGMNTANMSIAQVQMLTAPQNYISNPAQLQTLPSYSAYSAANAGQRQMSYPNVMSGMMQPQQMMQQQYPQQMQQQYPQQMHPQQMQIMQQQQMMQQQHQQNPQNNPTIGGYSGPMSQLFKQDISLGRNVINESVEKYKKYNDVYNGITDNVSMDMYGLNSSVMNKKMPPQKAQKSAQQNQKVKIILYVMANKNDKLLKYLLQNKIDFRNMNVSFEVKSFRKQDLSESMVDKLNKRGIKTFPTAVIGKDLVVGSDEIIRVMNNNLRAYHNYTSSSNNLAEDNIDNRGKDRDRAPANVTPEKATGDITHDYLMRYMNPNDKNFDDKETGEKFDFESELRKKRMPKRWGGQTDASSDDFDDSNNHEGGGQKAPTAINRRVTDDDADDSPPNNVNSYADVQKSLRAKLKNKLETRHSRLPPSTQASDKDLEDIFTNKIMDATTDY